MKASANIVLTFSEAVRAGSEAISIVRTADGVTVAYIVVSDAAQVRFGAGKTAAVVTIDPAFDLAAGTGYSIQIDPGAILNLPGSAYVGMSSLDALNFTTVSSGIGGVALTAGQLDWIASPPHTVAAGLAHWQPRRLPW